MIRTVKLSKQAERDLRKVPRHIAVKLTTWVSGVENEGLEQMRKVPSYHDEPLKRKLQGMRSIRLSKGYRAYYTVQEQEVVFVNVDRVDKHEY